MTDAQFEGIAPDADNTGEFLRVAEEALRRAVRAARTEEERAQVWGFAARALAVVGSEKSFPSESTAKAAA